jgi:hypothetical protein
LNLYRYAAARLLSVTRKVQKRLARRMGKSKLRGMLAEMKRYSKPTRPVVTILTALFLLLVRLALFPRSLGYPKP